jgi:maltose alpha-D-glucosyltransferase/alpha-amylase
LGKWAQGFREQVGARVLAAYLERARGSLFIPKEPGAVEQLMEFYELEKVLYEIRYELENRPDWLELPLNGLAHILTRVP